MLEIIIAAAAAAATTVPADPCSGSDTISISECMGGKIERATAQLRHYRAVAFNRFHDEGEYHDPATAKAIENAGIIAEANRTTYCDAVYQHWIEGSIRHAMRQGCVLRMINRETHDLWSDFLTYADSTPPVLPEPVPIE